MSSQPREIARPCPRCHRPEPSPNGAYYRELRLDAGLRLAEMARLVGLSVAMLSSMERGSRPFGEKHVEAYEAVCRRRRRAGVRGEGEEG